MRYGGMEVWSMEYGVWGMGYEVWGMRYQKFLITYFFWDFYLHMALGPDN